MAKLARHNLILELIGRGSVGSQDELRRQLGRRGLRVTQATLSRDIHELGLVKTPQGYALPGTEGRAVEPHLPSVARLMREFALDVRQAQNLLVLKTTVGSAQPVAAGIDAESWTEVVGTVAGDDVVLIISPNTRTAQRLAAHIREMLA